MKKVLICAIIVIALFVAAFGVACSLDNDSPDNSNSQSAQQESTVDQKYLDKVESYYNEKVDDGKKYKLGKAKKADKKFLKAVAASINELAVAWNDDELWYPLDVSDAAASSGALYILNIPLCYIATYEDANFNDVKLKNIASGLIEIIGEYEGAFDKACEYGVDSDVVFYEDELQEELQQLAVLDLELINSYDLSVKKANKETIATLASSSSYKVSKSGKLYEPADKSKLKKVIAKAKKKSSSKYTDESYKKLSKALSKGQSIFKKEIVSQEDVDEATSKIKNAISNLVKRPPSYSGYGDSVVKVKADYSMATVKASYSGGGNFVIWSLDSYKDEVDLLVNTVGSYSGTTLMGVDEDIAYLKISASGSWHIELGDPFQAPKIKNGKNYHGDSVMLFDKDSVDVFKFKNSGSGNIVLRGYDSAIYNYDLIINEIGSTSGEYVNYGYYLFEVLSEGTWSVKW